MTKPLKRARKDKDMYCLFHQKYENRKGPKESQIFRYLLVITDEGLGVNGDFGVVVESTEDGCAKRDTLNISH